MRILVIEDNPDDRALELREIHALYPGAEVIEVTEPGAFDAALAAGAPDLVLTDLDLRWSSGQDVLREVKSRYPGCPVVMFTGSGDETIAVDLMKAGLDDYVVKSPRQLSRLRISLKIAVDLAGSRAALSDREARLSRALAQQQVVSRELHHRVKNNLQTMSSMLRLRSRQVDAGTGLHLDEMAGRMEALAAVQARIYMSSDLGNVDFRAALKDIAASLVRIHHDGQVSLSSAGMAPLTLGVSRAMPLSLLCYEVILNAMKYAWPERQPGCLTVRIVGAKGAREIIIEDDGVGFDRQSIAAGMGSRLIRAMANEAEVGFATSSAPGCGTRIVLRLQ